MGSFTQKMVLKRPFVDDTTEDSALQIQCSGLPEDRVLSQYDSFT